MQDRHIEFQQFELVVQNIFHIYYSNVPIAQGTFLLFFIKSWLGRDGLQFTDKLTSAKECMRNY